MVAILQKNGLMLILCRENFEKQNMYIAFTTINNSQLQI